MQRRELDVTVSVGLILLAALSSGAAAQGALSPGYRKWALTPPMGWNSYDAFGDSVTEAEVMANASYMKRHLLSHGWTYVVVDYRWYDPGAHDNNPSARKGAELAMDEFGRLLPAPNRFPSNADGPGFGPLADRLHSMGLKFGIHVMRGIPRIAVKANLPIEGTGFHAWDACSFSICPWNPDMFGVDATAPAGRAYYDSIFRLYASWGVDFVKVDDLSSPYQKDEIHAIRDAIDKCGRSIVFSTSPGETPVDQADDISTHANMWRISGDFWDNWGSLDHAFDLGAAWHGHGGPGRWPDFDMLAVGKIGIRSVDGPRMSRFTHDEQLTLLTLWALGPSPLMLGANLPDNDDWTTALMTNDEMLSVDQDALGEQGTRVSQRNGAEVWVKELKDGSKAIGLFNRGNASQTVTLTWADAGLAGKQTLHDIWGHKDLGSFDLTFAVPVTAHGVLFLKASATTPAQEKAATL
jgi:alpha-galactosidase